MCPIHDLTQMRDTAQTANVTARPPRPRTLLASRRHTGRRNGRAATTHDSSFAFHSAAQLIDIVGLSPACVGACTISLSVRAKISVASSISASDTVRGEG